MTFIIDRCRRSWAVATPVKYEMDSKNLTGIFAELKISLMKLTNRALVTPTPGFGTPATLQDWSKATQTTL